MHAGGVSKQTWAIVYTSRCFEHMLVLYRECPSLKLKKIQQNFHLRHIEKPTVPHDSTVQ